MIHCDLNVKQTGLPMLTSEQISSFERDGYLVVPDFFPKADLTHLKNAAYEFVDAFDFEKHRSVFSTTDADEGRDEQFFRSAETVECFLEENVLDKDGQLTASPRRAVNKLGHALHDYLPAYTSFCKQPAIGEVLREIGYQDPLLWQTMVIFKPPKVGGAVRWHQDASYLLTEPANVTGLWVALEDANKSNGCLWMQPGQHRQPLWEIYKVDPESGEARLKSLRSEPEPVDPQPLEVTAGTLVLFKDHMPHYSSANTSDKSRVAFTLHVADAATRWLPENWIQRPTLGPFRL